MSSTDIDVLIVGAGPAGLATSQQLSGRGVGHLVLERGERPGHTWESLYDSLRLHTGRHLSVLPGMRYPRGVPMFPDRQQFVDYLHRYAERFGVPVEPRTTVVGAERANGGWRVHTSRGPISARVLVMATGIVSNPRTPRFPGQERFPGRILHSAEYRRPEPFAGQRVLIVGVGNSGGEIGSELAHAGAEVTVAVRSGAHVVPLTLAGLPIQYASFLLRKLPRPAQEPVAGLVARLTALRRGPPVLPRPPHGLLDGIPLIGFHLVDAIRAGRVRVRAGVEEFTERGVRFAGGEQEPFDTVILATGFEPALGPLEGRVRKDTRGFALRRDRVLSADHPDLFFVGHVYDALGALYNIALDSRLAAERISRLAPR